jgi:hypothetical protein
MALPTAYLTTVKNLDGVLAAIQNAKAPAKFTQQFLRGLGYSSSSDRLMINVLKALGFLSADGVPTQRYFEYLDQSQSARIMAEAVTEAYGDLFEVDTNAQKLSRAELKNKMRTLSQGQLTDAVLDKMAMTFTALVKQGDFDSRRRGASGTPTRPDPSEQVGDGPKGSQEEGDGDGAGRSGGSISEHLGEDEGAGPGRLVIDGLVYNIQIQLPESRDPKVYDALFHSLKKHLGR